MKSKLLDLIRNTNDLSTSDLVNSLFSFSPELTYVSLFSAPKGMAYNGNFKHKLRYMKDGKVWEISFGKSSDDSTFNSKLFYAFRTIAKEFNYSFVDNCGRCGGSGYAGPMNVHGGICFACNGSKCTYTVPFYNKLFKLLKK